MLIPISVVSYLQDHLTTKCKVNMWNAMISFAHHIFSTYTMFGGLLDVHRITHIITVLIVIASWDMFGYCLVTRWYNNLCDINPEEHHRDIAYRIHKATGLSHLTMAIASILLSLYKL